MPEGTSITSQFSAKKARDVSSQAGADWWLLYKVYKVSTSVMVFRAVVVIVCILSAVCCRAIIACQYEFSRAMCMETDPNREVSNGSVFNITTESVHIVMRKRI